jgi:hypothetical protein
MTRRDWSVLLALVGLPLCAFLYGLAALYVEIDNVIIKFWDQKLRWAKLTILLLSCKRSDENYRLTANALNATLPFGCKFESFQPAMAAHNRLVGGSSPLSPTTQSCSNRDFPVWCK